MAFTLIRIPDSGSVGSPSAGLRGDSFPTKKEAEEEVERKKIQNPNANWSIVEEN